MSTFRPGLSLSRSNSRAHQSRLNKRKAAQRRMVFESLEDRQMMAVWDGGAGANTNWSAPANWAGDVVPGAGEDIIFNSAVSTTNVNDLTPGITFNSIQFQAGAGVFIINGNPIALNGGVDVDSTGNQTLNTPLILTGASAVNVSAGSLTLGSTIAGTGSLTKTGAGTLTLSGAVAVPTLNVGGGTLNQYAPTPIVKLSDGPTGTTVPTSQLGLTNVAHISAGAVPFANSDIGVGTHSIANLNDGLYGNAESWIGVGANALAGVKLNAAYTVSGLSFGRDNLPGFTDRSVGNYTIYRTLVVNADHNTAVTGNASTGWVAVGDININAFDTAIRKNYALAPFDATGIMVRTDNGIAIDELEVYGVAAVAAPAANLNVTASATVNLGAGVNLAALNISGAGTVLNLNGSQVTTSSGGYAIGAPTTGPSVPAGTPVADNLALQSKGSIPFASSVAFNPPHMISNLNDGLYGNTDSWIGSPAITTFAGVDLSGVGIFNVNGISFGRDNTAPPGFGDRSDGTYTFYHTLVPNPNSSLPITENPATGWSTIGSVVVAGNVAKKTYPISQGGQPVSMTGFMISAPPGVAIDEIELHGTGLGPVNLPNLPVTVSSNATLNLPAGVSATVGALTIAGGGALTLTGASNVTVSSLFGSGAGAASVGGTPIQLANPSVDVPNGVNLTVNTPITATNALVKVGPGTLTLSNATGTNTLSRLDAAGGNVVLAGTSVTNVTGSIRVGVSPGSQPGLPGTQPGSGTLTIQDSAAVTVNNIFMGENNAPIVTGMTATINQTGGNVTVTGNNGENAGIRVGHWGSETSVYNMSGGTLTLTDATADIAIATDGIGTFNQTGGTVNAPGIWVDHRNDNGSANLDISGGTTNIGGRGLVVASDTATIRGTANVLSTGNISVGRYAAGTLNLQGTAQLRTNGELLVGDASTIHGFVNQTGGTLTVDNRVRLAHWPSPNTSVYTMSGGTLNVVNALNVGWDPLESTCRHASLSIL